MICFRPDREGLDEAMENMKKFETIEKMLKFICDEHNSEVDYFQITPEEIYIEDYGDDDRVGWKNCFIICFERPSKIKNIDGYKKYFNCTEECEWIKKDFPVGVIGMFTTDYDENILQEYMNNLM